MDEWEKFNQTTLPVNKIILEKLKYGRYYRCRLHACQKSL